MRLSYSPLLLTERECEYIHDLLYELASEYRVVNIYSGIKNVVKSILIITYLQKGQISRPILKQIRAKLELLTHNLQKMLNLLEISGDKISHIGDPHPSSYGKIVADSLNTAFRILPAGYKLPETILYELFTILKVNELMAPYKLYKTRNGYSIYSQPFVRYRPINDYKKFFYNYGQLIGASYILGIGDLIKGNVIIHRDSPIVIDYEIYLKPYFHPKNRLQNTFLWPPSLDLESPLSAGGIKLKNAVGLIRLSKNSCKAVSHIPYMIKPNILQNPYQYIPQILTGINEVFKAAYRNKEVIIDFLSSSFYTRFVKISTRYYYKAITLMFSSSYLSKINTFTYLLRHSHKIPGISLTYLVKSIRDEIPILRDWLIPVYIATHDSLHLLRGYKKSPVKYGQNYLISAYTNWISAFSVSEELARIQEIIIPE